MAFAFKGSGSATTDNNNTADQSSFVLTTSGTAGAVGDLAVLTYGMDNNATVDGDENAVTGIVDSAGNVWAKAVEFTNSQGVAQAGNVCGIWYVTLTAALAIGATVTLSFSNAASRDAFAVNLTYFTMAAFSTAAVEGTPTTLVNHLVAQGSLDCTTSNIECLRVRSTASENSSTTVWTKTAAFDGLLTQAVAIVSGATSMGLRGEYDISTGTSQASAPTGGAGSVDHASVYAAFKEVAGSSPEDIVTFGVSQDDGRTTIQMIGY